MPTALVSFLTAVVVLTVALPTSGIFGPLGYVEFAICFVVAVAGGVLTHRQLTRGRSGHRSSRSGRLS